jgi:ATP-dependent RNA helicase DDX56/DBP9
LDWTDSRSQGKYRVWKDRCLRPADITISFEQERCKPFPYDSFSTLLNRPQASSAPKAISALVLVPTRELAEQVHKSFVSLAAFCAKDVRSINLTQRVSDTVLRSILADSPDIVISTPGKVSQTLSSTAFSLENLTHLVIDEADLVLSYGYEDDINTIAKSIPSGVQTLLMSATLTTEVDTLKGLFCKDPAILKLQEKDEEGEGVTQYVVKCAEDEKFLLTYVIFKLRLIKGKCIIFVEDVDRSYRLKLFLEQFSVKSCVLNSELPINSRIHVVQEFNKGVYDIIIAADDQEIIGGIAPKKARAKEATEDGDHGEASSGPDDSEKEDAEQPRKKRKLLGKNKDYGVSRGIDFQNVACVLNFDLPSSSKAYTHRIGRTARAGKTGMALSFVIPKDLYGKHKPTSIASAKHNEAVLEKITKRQAKKGKEVKPYHFDMKQVDVFRYRMGDALRAVTRAAVREARAKELKRELLKSEKLKKHFEENPDDLRHLRHDNEVRAARVQSHLKHVPDYLVPVKGRKGLTANEVGFVGVARTSENRLRKARMHNRSKGKSARTAGRKFDPLKSFNARGRKK